MGTISSLVIYKAGKCRRAEWSPYHVMLIATHDPYKVKISTQLIVQMWPQTPGVLMAPFETLIIGAFVDCIIG